MYVSVSLWFPGGPTNLNRGKFWKTYEQLLEGVTPGESVPEVPRPIANQYEDMIRRGFPRHLQRHLNEEMATVAVLAAQRPYRPITVRLLAIQYGSIKAILDIVGLESTDLRDLLLAALSIYAPVAFNECLPHGVDVSASVELMADDVPATSSAPQVAKGPTTLSARANDAVARIWTITNLTLVVPVLLSLVVLYYAYSGLLHELQGLRTQAADIKAERTDILKALVDHNKTLSTSNGDQAKQAIANEKAMQDALIGILKDKGQSAEKSK